MFTSSYGSCPWHHSWVQLSTASSQLLVIVMLNRRQRLWWPVNPKAICRGTWDDGRHDPSMPAYLLCSVYLLCLYVEDKESSISAGPPICPWARHHYLQAPGRPWPLTTLESRQDVPLSHENKECYKVIFIVLFKLDKLFDSGKKKTYFLVCKDIQLWRANMSGRCRELRNQMCKTPSRNLQNMTLYCIYRDNVCLNLLTTSIF